MECPRCGSPLETYALGDQEARTCSSCGYAGVPVDHHHEPPEFESWQDALQRFHEAARERRAAAVATVASERTDGVTDDANADGGRDDAETTGTDPDEAAAETGDEDDTATDEAAAETGETVPVEESGDAETDDAVDADLVENEAKEEA